MLKQLIVLCILLTLLLASCAPVQQGAAPAAEPTAAPKEEAAAAGTGNEYVDSVNRRKGETYDQQLGDRARKAIGTKKWLKRVHEAIANMHTLTNFDHLAIGGGNAKHLEGEKLAKNISLVDNSAGILGGIRLWDNRVGDV